MKKYIDKLELKRVPTLIEKTKISSSNDFAKFAKKIFGDQIDVMESFHVVMLNHANETVDWAQISLGGISETSVDIRIIAKYCLDTLATSVILTHNHPSGNLKTSQSDRNITDRIKKALNYIDVKVLDHIILTRRNGHLSFADDGIL